MGLEDLLARSRPMRDSVLKSKIGVTENVSLGCPLVSIRTHTLPIYKHACVRK